MDIFTWLLVTGSDLNLGSEGVLWFCAGILGQGKDELSKNKQNANKRGEREFLCYKAF